MARHRKRPVSRHQAPGPDGSPASYQAPYGRWGSAMRRVVVTPTFAAGLGVVVAAVLALQMHTVFNYAPPGGTTCQVAGCAISSQSGGHTASGPTRRLSTPGSAAAHSGGNGSTSDDKDSPAGGGGSPV